MCKFLKKNFINAHMGNTSVKLKLHTEAYCTLKCKTQTLCIASSFLICRRNSIILQFNTIILDQSAMSELPKTHLVKLA